MCNISKNFQVLGSHIHAYFRDKLNIDMYNLKVLQTGRKVFHQSFIVEKKLNILIKKIPEETKKKFNATSWTYNSLYFWKQFTKSNNFLKPNPLFFSKYSDERILNLNVQALSYIGNSLEKDKKNIKISLFKQMQDVGKILNQSSVSLQSKYKLNLQNKTICIPKSITFNKSSSDSSNNLLDQFFKEVKTKIVKLHPKISSFTKNIMSKSNSVNHFETFIKPKNNNKNRYITWKNDISSKKLSRWICSVTRDLKLEEKRCTIKLSLSYLSGKIERCCELYTE